MNYLISEITSTEEMKAFVDFPHRLYKGHPFYVPPLKRDERTTLRVSSNPAHAYCTARYWLAWHEKKVVGRIAGILNKSYNLTWKKKYIRFGWFDCNDDQKLAADLLRQVEHWAEEEGMEAVHGPLGFTNFDPAGILLEGYDQLATVAVPYNYPYYAVYLEQAGYQKEVDWVEYRIEVPPVVPQKIVQLASIVSRRNGLSILAPITQETIKSYSFAIFQLINTAYKHLHGVVALTDRQIQYYIKKYSAFIRPDYIALVINTKGELVAFSITMPSLARALQKARGSLFPWGIVAIQKALRKNTEAELCLIAVHPDYQGKGVNALLMEEMNKSFIRNKITVVESNPELEDNTRVQSIWTYYEAKRHKRRRCFIKYVNK